MRYELSPKNTVIVRGPASVISLGGHPTILGGPFASGHRKIVERQKQLPIETESHAELEIILGRSAGMFELEGSSIPASWREAAATVQQMKEGIVAILGQPDVGKSTLCTYLINRLWEHRRTVRVIDADIGQADLGPPTTIAEAAPTNPISSLQELTPHRRLFIGHISPSGVEQKLIHGILRLSAGREKSLIIINTDGWIADPEAIWYKIDLLTQVQPNLILSLAYSNELEPILDGVTFDSLKIDAAQNALKRSRLQRRGIRAYGYRSFLAGAVTRRVGIENIHLTIPPHFPGIETPHRRKLNNLILGILDEEGYLTEIGILTKIEDDAIWIFSRQSRPFPRVEIGHVKVSMSGREMGFL